MAHVGIEGNAGIDTVSSSPRSSTVIVRATQCFSPEAQGMTSVTSGSPDAVRVGPVTIDCGRAHASAASTDRSRNESRIIRSGTISSS